jgi:hypothetical protein
MIRHFGAGTLFMIIGLLVVFLVVRVAFAALVLTLLRVFPEKRAMGVAFLANLASLFVGFSIAFFLREADLEPWAEFLLVGLPAFAVEVFVLVKSRGFRSLGQAALIALIMNVVSSLGMWLVGILILW